MEKKGNQYRVPLYLNSEQLEFVEAYAKRYQISRNSAIKLLLAQAQLMYKMTDESDNMTDMMDKIGKLAEVADVLKVIGGSK